MQSGRGLCLLLAVLVLLFFGCVGFVGFVVECCFFAWSLSLLSGAAAAEVVDVASVVVASIGGRAGCSVVVVTMVELVVGCRF